MSLNCPIVTICGGLGRGLCRSYMPWYSVRPLPDTSPVLPGIKPSESHVAKRRDSSENGWRHAMPQRGASSPRSESAGSGGWYDDIATLDHVLG